MRYKHNREAHGD